MNPRTLRKTARIAVEVRRLQDQAALLKLQAQQAVVASAAKAYDGALRAEADSQEAWRLSMDGPLLNPELLTAWHHRARQTSNGKISSAARLRAEQALASDRASDWRRHLCLTQAASSVLRKAEKRAQRLAEETLLATAEDIRNARWVLR